MAAETRSWADLARYVPKDVMAAARRKTAENFVVVQLRYGRREAVRELSQNLADLPPPSPAYAEAYAPLIALAGLLKDAGGGVPGPSILDLPDIRQPDYFGCGAAAAMSVGRFFGVGPAELPEWYEALNTTIRRSTHPDAIETYLRSLGLEVEARGGMSVADLAECVAAGRPVIVPIQDYGPGVPAEAEFAYGHYLVVIGVTAGRVVCQDSSEDNVTEDSGTIAEPGRVLIRADVFVENWHDVDADGREFKRYGIAVGPGQMGAVKGFDPNEPRDESGEWTSGGGAGEKPKKPKKPSTTVGGKKPPRLPQGDPVHSYLEGFAEGGTAEEARSANDELEGEESEYRVVPTDQGGWAALPAEDLEDEFGEDWTVRDNPLTGKPEVAGAEYFDELEGLAGDDEARAYLQPLNSPPAGEKVTLDDVAQANVELAEAGSDWRIDFDSDHGLWAAVPAGPEDEDEDEPTPNVLE